MIVTVMKLVMSLETVVMISWTLDVYLPHQLLYLILDLVLIKAIMDVVTQQSTHLAWEMMVSAIVTRHVIYLGTVVMIFRV